MWDVGLAPDVMINLSLKRLDMLTFILYVTQWAKNRRTFTLGNAKMEDCNLQPSEKR